MKINVSIDCTPEEARRFIGLPDVTRANDAYVEALAKTMQGVGNIEQLQDYAKSFAPMGQIGLKLVQQFLENAGKAKGAGD